MNNDPMSAGSPLPPEIAFQVDFNFQQAPSALGVNVTPQVAAAMLNIKEAEYLQHLAHVAGKCQREAERWAQTAIAKRAMQRLLANGRGAKTQRIMVMGDSITTYREGYAEVLRQLIAMADPDIAFRNEGRSGYTTTHALEHTFTQYIPASPDWVIVMYGVNDTKRFAGNLLVSCEEYTRNLSAIVDAFVSRDANVVVMTPTTVDEALVHANPIFREWQMSWSNDDLFEFADAAKALGETRGVKVVDLTSVFTRTPDPSLLLPDGLHPGSRGHHLILDRLLTSLGEE